MVRSLSVYGKKLLSLSLTFNALLTIVYAVGILTGFYVAQWNLFGAPVLNGALFWFIIPPALINLFPAMKVGRVHTGRLWFHHYVYGFFVLLVSTAFVMLFTSVSLISLFTENLTEISANVGRFFILGGLVLVLDDFGDISRYTESVLNGLKAKAYQKRKAFHIIQYLMAAIACYFIIAVCLWFVQRPHTVTLANIILLGTLIVTCFTSIAGANRKIWLNMTTETDSTH